MPKFIYQITCWSGQKSGDLKLLINTSCLEYLNPSSSVWVSAEISPKIDYSSRTTSWTISQFDATQVKYEWKLNSCDSRFVSCKLSSSFVLNQSSVKHVFPPELFVFPWHRPRPKYYINSQSTDQRFNGKLLHNTWTRRVKILES